MKNTKRLVLIMPNMIRSEGEDDGDTTFSQEDVDAAIATAVAAAVTASTDDAAKLASTNKGLLADIKKQKENAKKFDGVDLVKYKTVMGAFENDQDISDIADGKFPEVIKRHLERDRAEDRSNIEGLNAKILELEGGFNIATDKVSTLMIDSKVVAEFIGTHNGLDSAMPDVVSRAKQTFKVEGDELIARDAKGEIITGAKGPITVSEWVVGLKKTAPHLFQGSKGSNVVGGDADGSDDGSLKGALDKGGQKAYREMRKTKKA